MGTGLQKNSRIRVLIHHSFLAIRPLKENQSESGNGLPEPFGADSMAGLPFAAGAGELPGVLSAGAPHSVQNALPSGISEPPALWASGRMPGTGEYYHRELRASGRTGCFLYREGYSSRFIHFTRPATSRSSSGSRKCEVNSDMSPFAL